MTLLQQHEANAAQARQNAVNTVNGYRDAVMNNQVAASVYATTAHDANRALMLSFHYLA